jgi:hypothetical protein
MILYHNQIQSFEVNVHASKSYDLVTIKWWVVVEIVIGFVCSAIGIALGFFVLKLIFFVLSHLVQKKN